LDCRDGLIDLPQRIIQPARLKRNHAQEMQRIGVLRLRRENLPIDGIRLLKLPGRVMHLRKLQRLRNGHLLLRH